MRDLKSQVPQRSSIDVLAARIEAGNRVAEDLETITKEAPVWSRHELAALASRIRLCNDPSNSWYVPNATAKHTFDRYDAIGRFWRCGSKLCADCLARHSRMTRKRLRAALNGQTPHRGERYYFITFTIPNPDLPLVATRSIVDYAWSLFRKRLLVVSLVRGGAKSEEFTVTPRGFHYHLHVIWLSKYMQYQEVRRVWTECVSKAFAEAHQPFVCNNKDGYLSVVVKPVKPNEGIIHEVCKYITKSNSWSKLRPSDLVEVALIRKWSRMFELFGSFRVAARSDAASDEPILDTRPSNDGDPRAVALYWRDRVAVQNLDDYMSDLYDEWNRCVNGRLRQLELRWYGCRVWTYAEIQRAKAGP